MTGKGEPLKLLRALLRVGFGLLYNQLAWTYDLVSWTVSMGQWRSWQRTALPYLRGKQVLEVAHGTGNMLLDLVSLGFEPAAIDLSPSMGRLAARKIRRKLNAPRCPVPLFRASVFNLPFAAGSFQSLLSTFPTEFMVQQEAVGEFWRVLRPGGVFVCVPAAQITGLNLMDRWAAWLFRITGQSAEGWFAPVVERYSQAGFAARTERVQLPRSIVTVIVAEKS